MSKLLSKERLKSNTQIKKNDDFETEKAKSKNAPLQVIDESDKKANYLLRLCQPITDTISFIFKYIDPTDEEELINCACSTGKK